MSQRLDAKVALITGGDGIARATALRFAAEGARIIGVDIDGSKVGETARLVAAAGGDMIAIGLDLTDEAAVDQLMAQVDATHGGIDILAHFAMSARHGEVERHTVEDFDYTLHHNATMAFIMCKHVVPVMRKGGGGAIVLAGSVSGSVGTGCMGNTGHFLSYAVAKSAVIRLGIVLANDLGRHGIRVNLVSPGPVATPNALSFFGPEGSEARALLVDRQSLLGRISYPDDVANAVLFLASDEASNITGQNLYVDGGFQASGGFGSADERVRDLIDRMAGAAPPEACQAMPTEQPSGSTR